MARLELTTPRTQNECATNCATSRLKFLITYVKEDFRYYNAFCDSCKFFAFFWGEWRGLNPRHPEPQPGALPTELHPPYKFHVPNYTGFTLKIKIYDKNNKVTHFLKRYFNDIITNKK